MEIWKTLLPILVADIVNPVLFAFMVYAAGSSRPVVNSSCMLLGHTVAYLGAGIALSFGLEALSERIANPKSIDFGIEFIVALVLLWVAYRSVGASNQEPDQTGSEIGPVKAFGYGMVINFIGIPFAVPYFAAISQILKSDPSFFEALSWLVVYNMLYALPFLVVPILVAVMGERSRSVLGKMSDVLDRVSGFLIPILLVLVAVALLADSGHYFWTGRPLF